MNKILLFLLGALLLSGCLETPETLKTWDLEKLMNMEKPILCTVAYTTTFNDKPTFFEYTMYIKGDKLRLMGSIAPVVIKENTVYMRMPGFGDEQCEWLANYSSYDDLMAEFRNEEPVEFDCFSVNFGDEKFDTPGTVCDYTNYQ